VDYLAQVREAHAAIEALGVQVIAVGTGSPEQARRLMERGTPFPCLVDPHAELYRVLGFGRVGWRTALDPATYTNYWRAWRRGARQGSITGDPRQLSGVAILDAQGRLRWRHASRTIGDYPRITGVIVQLRGCSQS
jgi:AhpC/TSA antioxidant enzyme